MKLAPLIAATSVACALAVPSFACTTAQMTAAQGPVVAKSYDWHSSEGMVFINKAGMKKSALILDPGTPATWTSQFASVTFNQYGREMPNGGMNTEGLVVEVMWLRETKTPDFDERPAISELQWIQYQLDRFSSVKDVVEHAPDLRVAPVYGTVHYLVCDRSAACAAIEYLDGKLVITDGEDLKAPVLANHSYADSAKYLKRHAGFGGRQAVASGRGSLNRFARAATQVRATAGRAKVSDAFALLDSVSQGSYSVWHIVYDPTTLTAHFRTRDTKTQKSVRLGAFDTSCGTPVKMLDIDTPDAGDATGRMADYTLDANRRLVHKTLGALRGLPKPLALALAAYPEHQVCTLGQ